ncbi:MAG: autoinducer binding domain-containing protein [Rhodoferax sp.]|uniref:autoinducer binding domain-containing protein n=1 Tax=Rhodoferax sp. TaxID=50421 RepID=UPI002619E998|nr:autoinducer binding domain-containing protein [Rhodoferax sp.]MDD5333740.1 autoinducer binding domain-containing protein [Rhodoferax sp.]
MLGTTGGVPCEHATFKKIEAGARALGFEHCALGLRAAQPFSGSRAIVLNHYAAPWWVRYISEGSLHTDSTVLHGRRTHTPLNWNDKVSGSARQLWDEAQRCGLRVGWTQSSLEVIGVADMLTLSRSREVRSAVELASQEIKLRWLVNVSHLTLSGIFVSRLREQIPLTAREIEVLRWSADGKTSGQISEILAVSENTVNFHVKNAVAKLQTANKTAAVARAAKLGFLN